MYIIKASYKIVGHSEIRREGLAPNLNRTTGRLGELHNVTVTIRRDESFPIFGTSSFKLQSSTLGFLLTQSSTHFTLK